MAWSELNQADGDIQTQPPNFYAFDASVKTSHTKDDIIALAQKHGLTNIIDYREEAVVDGYREVGVVAQATSSSKLPWALPWPLSMGDSSKVLRAWATPPESQAPTSPLVSKPSSSPSAMVLGVLGGAALVGLAYVFVFRRRR